MRIRENMWYEAIVSVLADGQPYFTPLGFQIYGNAVKLKVYISARISSLLTTYPNAVLNITDDPHLYFLSTFKEETGGIPKEEVGFIDGLPVLRSAYGYIIARRSKILPQEEVFLFEYRVEKVIENPAYYSSLEPYSRCRAFLIEMIIYASKIREVSSKPEREELQERFEKFFDYSHEVVWKTCMDEAELKLASKLKEMVSGWARK